MIYFIGIGGIGMSGLARFFNGRGVRVAGYDLTPTRLTDSLIAEGIEITFTDKVDTINSLFTAKGPGEGIVVVYTPAIPGDNKIFTWFTTNGYRVVKRSALLGLLVNDRKAIAVAGTHGKTSVSVLIAHLLMQTPSGCNAFLGGVSKNYNTNLLASDRGTGLFVVEADEFDRSFLQLFPQTAVITSIDPDHLDIYGNFDELKRAFSAFLHQVKDGGTVICNSKVAGRGDVKNDTAFFTYGLNDNSDFSAVNISIPEDGLPVFDLVAPQAVLKNLKLGVPGRFNIENATAAIAVALVHEVPEAEIRSGLESFKGVHRRFDIKINNPECVFIDDYAHHPAEIKACLSSLREWFPGRRLTAIFQPHLYSRTRDFAREFAESLEDVDELILLDIYPAREEPLPGVSSELIFNYLRLTNKTLCNRQQLPDIISGMKTDVVVTLGAGNIDVMVEPIRRILLNKTGEGSL
jgi:UDP-N-acetylmuramate--alanine ligase